MHHKYSFMAMGGSVLGLLILYRCYVIKVQNSSHEAKNTSVKMKLFYNHYFTTIWSVVLTWNNLIKTSNLTEINGNLPEPQVLSRIINEFVRPMFKSFSLDNTLFRSLKTSAVERAVKERIEELQEFLQDSDGNIYNKDNYTLADNDETAIIEFLPKTKNADNRTKFNAFKYNLKEYKTITHKIQKALTKESVSEKTKSLIINTLNELVKKLIEGQCNWKRTRVDKTQGPYLIINEWKAGWQEIKKTISKFLASDPRRHSNIPKYVENLHKILKKITRDADLISKKYKIQCQFVPKVSYLSTTENTNNLRNNWDKTEMEADTCQNVVVCSKELKTFMLHFYKNLNDTTISVIKNYAEMYDKDVHTGDVKENKYIVTVLANISNDLQGYISEIFIKETKKITLDKAKKSDANIKFLSDYIKNNIKNVKEKIRKILRTQLVNIREKISHDVRNDVMVNLNVDLGNLEQEYLKQICTAFRLCSGKYAGRRQLFSESVNKNNINLQVQLAFDDKLPGYRRNELELPTNETTKYFKYVSDFNVTRTTLFNTTSK